MEELLQLARWTPSGDNVQPWRFELINNNRMIVHGHVDGCVYDFDYRASHMAHGALLETLRIVASGLHQTLYWQLIDDRPAGPRYEVWREPMERVERDSLWGEVDRRHTERRRMGMQALSAARKALLQSAVGDAYELQFFDSLTERLAVGALMALTGNIRYHAPEAYAAHRAAVAWNCQYSDNHIPDRALGVGFLTRRLMRWGMQSWARTQFLNSYLGGTLLPRLTMDLLPAVACSSHLLLKPRRAPQNLADWLDTGIAMQRLWLTASQLDLGLQPEMAPVIFRWYAQAHRAPSVLPGTLDQCYRIAIDFERLGRFAPEQPLAFFCRVGPSPGLDSRALRLPVEKLRY